MQIGDVIIYPGHGISVVMDETVDSSFAQETGLPLNLWAIKILDGSMIVRVNKTTSFTKGIRPLASREDANKVFDIFALPKSRMDVSTWNRRFRDYTNKVRSGGLIEMATVYRELSVIRITKDLSFGERKVFEQVELMIAQELSCILDVDESEVLTKMRSYFVGLDLAKPRKEQSLEEDEA